MLLLSELTKAKPELHGSVGRPTLVEVINKKLRTVTLRIRVRDYILAVHTKLSESVESKATAIPKACTRENGARTVTFTEFPLCCRSSTLAVAPSDTSCHMDVPSAQSHRGDPTSAGISRSEARGSRTVIAGPLVGTVAAGGRRCCATPPSRSRASSLPAIQLNVKDAAGASNPDDYETP